MVRFGVFHLGVLLAQAQAIPESIPSILERQLPRMEEPDRRRYADDLAGALESASPAQKSLILSNLNQAVGYHVTRLDFQLRRYRRVDVPADFVREGYDLEFAYLTQRVLRAARNAWTEESKQAAVRQIGDLADSMERGLRDRLLGEAGRGYVARETEAARRSWLGSLDLPFNRFVDGPLAPEQLERAKAAILGAIADFSPIELTPSDAASRDRLVELGVLRLMTDALDAGFVASQQCFVEFRGPEARCADWKARLETRFGEARKAAAGAAFEALERERERDEPEENPAPAGTGPAAKAAVEAPAEVRVTAPKAAPSAGEASDGARTAALVAALTILVAYAGWRAYRWSRSA